MLRTLAMLVSLVTLSACRSTPPAPPVPHSATDVSASFGRTWDAVIDVFATKNIPIRTLERASGFIAAEQASVPAVVSGKELYKHGHPWADCGRGGNATLPTLPATANYNIRVKGDSARSTVQVTVQFRTVGPRPTECSTKAVWEKEVESDIKARAEVKPK